MPQTQPQTAPCPDAVEPLLSAVLEPGYRFALRLTREGADAEDLLQEAALRACRFFHQFQAGTNFRSWFFRILANCYKNRLRSEGRRGETLSIDDAPPLHLYLRSSEIGLHDVESDPASALLSRLGADRIVKALTELPDEYRTVATLYFTEDFTYPEIAEVLQIPVGTVRSRLHRGRRILQKRLWDVALEYGLVPAEDEE